MGRQDSPESPLSSMADSDAFEDSVMEDHDHDHENENENEPEGGHGSPLLPPAKRQKIISNIDSTASSAIIPRDDHEDHTMSDISSDTSGSVPSSPQCYPTGRLDVEDDIMEQVTVCLWDGCEAGDLGNMDELVKHLHNVHIQDLQQTGTYTCEWVGCNRKGKKHASGYALKAHMRSHTREKPFYCYLPECDRSFTRSDALAKHMRTVHETEALRPSDPVPKSMQPGGGQPGPNYATIPPLGTPSPATTNGTNKRLKIILKTPSLHAGGAGGTPDDAVLSSDGGGHENADGTATDDADYLTPLTIDLGFTERELDMPLEKLHRVCRWQLKWATEEGEELRREADELEQLYWREWRQKEALMTQVVRSEVDYNERRKQVERGEADIVAAAAASGGALANGDVQPPAPTPTPLTLGPLRQPAVRQTGGLMHPQEAATRAQEL